jgi:hypothetical protein
MPFVIRHVGMAGILGFHFVVPSLMQLLLFWSFSDNEKQRAQKDAVLLDFAGFGGIGSAIEKDSYGEGGQDVRTILRGVTILLFELIPQLFWKASIFC